MAAVLALELLHEAVVARFAAEGPAGVDQPFGWRWPAQLHVGPRIVWIPGDPIGVLGRVGPARDPGREPRSIGTLEEQFHVLISSQDPVEAEDERLQYRTTRLLRDYWLRAVYLAAHGTYTLESEEWVIDKKERRFGTELRVMGWIQSMVPDLPPAGSLTAPAPPDTSVELEVSELDVTETQIIEPPPPPA